MLVVAWLIKMTMTVSCQREIYMSIVSQGSIQGSVISDLSPLTLGDCIFACCSVSSCRFVSVELTTDRCALLQYSAENSVSAPYLLNLRASTAYYVILAYYIICVILIITSYLRIA